MARMDYESPPVNGNRPRLIQDPLLPAQLIEFVRETCNDFITLRSERGFLRENDLIGGSAKIGGFSVFTMLYYTTLHSCHNPSTQASTRLNGYRAAQHFMQLAHKFKQPIVVFTTSQSSLEDPCLAEPRDAQGVSNLLLSQCCLEAPIILVVLSRWSSGDIFGTWLADKMLALEETQFLLTTLEQETIVPVQVEAQHLVRQGFLDLTIPTHPGRIHDSQPTMPDPKQLQATLKEALEDVSHTSFKELRARRRERIERISKVATQASGLRKRIRVTSLNGSIATI